MRKIDLIVNCKNRDPKTLCNLIKQKMERLWDDYKITVSLGATEPGQNYSIKFVAPKMHQKVIITCAETFVDETIKELQVNGD